MRRDLKNTAALKIACCAIALLPLGFFHCSRDNPLDSKGKNYMPGAPPEARFLQDTLKAFIKDSVVINAAYRDTEAAGGRTPAVEMLYFNWDGDSTRMTDSVSAAGNDSVAWFSRYFLTHRSGFAYVRAKDNDGEFSPAGRMRLVIDEGKPRITGVVAPDTVFTGDMVTISVRAADTNGTVRSYIWNVNNGGDVTTPDSFFTITFGSPPGLQKVAVRVRDDDGVESPADTVKITSRIYIDTVGPAIQFLSPQNGDIVTSPGITVIVLTKDRSGTGPVLINNSSAHSAGGPDTSKTWMRDTLSLQVGSNSITVMAWDKSGNFNVSTKSITVTYSRNAIDTTPPAIVFVTPQPKDIVYQSPLEVVVSVFDQSGVAWVKCNDSLTMVNTSGNNYRATIALSLGRDTLIIKAADLRGNMAIDTLPLTYMLQTGNDTVPPRTDIIAPQPNQRIAAPDVQVKVFASDASGIASVTVNGGGASYLLGHYVADVLLSHGCDTIRVVATDSSANHNQTKDSVIVFQNAPPHFAPDSSVKDTNLVQGRVASIPLCAADPDNDPFTFSFITLPAKGGQNVTITRAGNCAAIEQYVSTAPGDTGLDTFRVKVQDAPGASDTLLVRVFLSSPQDVTPFFTTDTSTIPHSALVGALYAVQLTAVDPNNLPLTWLLVRPPAPDSAGIDAAGKVTWTPVTADTGQKTIRAIVTNGAESDTLEWAVTVVMPDLPPVLTNPGNRTIQELEPVQFALTASDPNGDTLVYSFGSSFPAGARITGTMFTWTPTNAGAGVYTTVFKVTERDRTPPLSDSTAIIITVVDTTTPVFATLPSQMKDTAYVERNYCDTVGAVDADLDFFPSLVYRVLIGPAGLCIDGKTGIVTWMPSASQANQTFDVSVIAADNAGNSDTLAWRITALPIQNLLKDPSFENSDTSVWKMGFSGGRSIVNTVAQSGTHSEQMVMAPQGFPRAVWQTVTVSANTSYDVSGWVKTDFLTTGAHIMILWFNTAAPPQSQMPAGFMKIDTVGTTLTGTNDWTSQSGTCIAPAGALTAQVYLECVCVPGTGTAWFDNLSFAVHH